MDGDGKRFDGSGDSEDGGGGRRYNLVDLFAGCGGLSQGFAQAGFTVMGACEMEDAPANTLRLNHRATAVVQGDIRLRETKDAICRILDGHRCDVVVGGPACQPFSSSGRRRRDQNDPRIRLYEDYLELVGRLRPLCVVMENVPLISSAKLPDGSPVLGRIIDGLRGLGYASECRVLDAADYGVPQRRRRLVLVGARAGIAIRFPGPTHSSTAKDGLPAWRTIRGAIGDLEDAPEDAVWSHVFPRHGSNVLRRIRETPNGGTCGLGKLKDDFVRCPPDKPSKTIRTVGWPIHYSRDRLLTPREAARLQSFSDSFMFAGTKTEVARMIGNAVPVDLARAVAGSIREMLDGRARTGVVRHARDEIRRNLPIMF